MERARRGATARVAPSMLVGVLAAVLVGCGTTSLSPQPSTTANSSGTIGGLPSLGLANVETETAAARGAKIGPAGGSISVTGSNGVTYTLTIPEDAVSRTTDIAMYPVTALATLSKGSSLASGVQFSPDGLSLLRPAMLSISLASTIDPKAQAGVAWAGDGVDPHRYPVIVDDSSLRVPVFHFSGVGVADPLDLPLEPLSGCTSNAAMDSYFGIDAEARDRDGFTRHLKDCYANFVAPALASGIEAAGGTDPKAEDEASLAYLVWLAEIGLAGEILGDPSFTVSPELGRSRGLAANLLRAWYDWWNRQCQAHAQDRGVALVDAVFAMEQRVRAEEFKVATKANRLDRETLLDDLCIQVVIDPSRSYSATGPGETGAVKLAAGYRVGGGPLIFDPPLNVQVSLTGATDKWHGQTNASGLFEQDLTWPLGVDLIRIDILATVEVSDDALTEIARFDRITKRAARGESHTGAIQDVRAPDIVGYCQPFTATAWGQGGTPVNGMQISGNILSTFTVTSGPATVTEQQGDVAAGTLDTSTDWIQGYLPTAATFLSGHTEGTIVLSAVATHPAGTGTASLPIVALLGLFHTTDPATSLVLLVDASLSADGEITYTAVASGAGPGLTWRVPGESDRLQADNALGLTGHSLDLRLDGDHLVGDLDGASVDLLRECPGPARYYVAADD